MQVNHCLNAEIAQENLSERIAVQVVAGQFQVFELCPLWMSWMSMNSIFQFQSTWMFFTVDLNLGYLCSRLPRKKRL